MSILPSNSTGPGPRRRTPAGTIEWLCVLVIALGSLPLQGQSSLSFTNALRRDFWDTDGTVNTMVATNGVVYVGGKFSRVAPKGRKVAAFDFYTAAPDSEFPEIVGASVDAIIDDGQGGWFIGGEFNEVGGAAVANLAHILANNQIDPTFQPNPDKRVRALALDDNILYVGGEFGTVGGETRGLIAAIDTTSNTLLPWSPNASQAGLAPRSVSALIVGDGIVYVGGLFSAIGGATRTNIAALDQGSGLAVQNWNPASIGEVLSFGLVEGRLFAGGSFNSMGGRLRNGLASLNAVTGAVDDWNPNPLGGTVHAIRVDCNTLYAGGSFTNLGGTLRLRAGAVDADSGLATDWNPNIGLFSTLTKSSVVLDLELFGNTIYLAGEFSSVDDTVRQDLAAVDSQTGALLLWEPNTTGGVTAVAAAGRKVLAGFLSSPGGVQRNNLAAFDEITGAVREWNPGCDGEVLALVAAGNRIYAGGKFTQLGGASRRHIAAIEINSDAAVDDWNPGAGTNVHALVAAGSRLYAGGEFQTMDGKDRLRLAALDLTTGTVLDDWAPTVSDGTVRALALSGSTLYLGGSFSSFVNATSRSRLAAIDLTGGLLLPWNPGPDSTVFALAVSGSTLFAGGDFSYIGGQARAGLAAVDNGLGYATLWDPGADARVNALTVAGSALYAAGSFTRLGGETRLGVGAIDFDGALLDWNPGGPGGFNNVRAITVSSGTLYAGGAHELRYASSPSIHSLAAFPQVGAPSFTQTPRDVELLPGQEQTAMFEAVVQGQAPLRYQWSHNGIPLPDATNAVLQIDSVNAAHAGLYRIVVTNALGATTATATLAVLEPAIIIAQSFSQTADPGETVTLTVTATGSPPPLYQWRLNGATIPGAVFPTLTLTSVQPSSAGSYDVVVANSVNAESSAVIDLIVNSAALPFADGFDARGTISGASGAGRGSNIGAAREPGEPSRYAGKQGGASVWLKWTAPANGVATFSTRGSGFDTLLAIYSGLDLNSFEGDEIASDEDRGGFFTSEATFNAVAGTEYAIVVDGLAGAMGNVVLTWNLDLGAGGFPRITLNPQSQSVTNGGTVVFEVEVSSSSPTNFQWFFGCRDLPGETNRLLIISNAQRRHVGSYHVVVMNGSTRAAQSLNAALELGPNPAVVSIDKLADAIAVLNGTGGGQQADGAGGGASPGPALNIGFGTIVSQTFDTSTNTTSLGDPIYCGVSGGASAMLHFVPDADGFIMVDTIGSSFDTVLVVLDGFLQEIDCDDNGAPDRIRSQLFFPATAGMHYLAVVDGVNGLRGPAKINWQLAVPPVPVSTPPPVRTGDVIHLAAPALLQPEPLPNYQWWYNGAVLPEATGRTLDVTPDQAGTYRVVISNFAGTTNYDITLPSDPVDLPLLTSTLIQTVDGPRLLIRGASEVGYLLQSSGDWLNWSTFWTNTPGAAPFEQLITPAEGQLRFYRARLWP